MQERPDQLKLTVELVLALALDDARCLNSQLCCVEGEKLRKWSTHRQWKTDSRKMKTKHDCLLDYYNCG